MVFNGPNSMENPFWYKDAIIYEVHVRTFYDSNGDGIGDFRGLIEKLDYLQRLGITTLWLLPFYPSPLRDDGYDIADYYSVHPDYGTLKDFKEFLKQAHLRRIHVITELVLNHTSDQHPWFQKSRRAKPGSVWREYYVWSETPNKYREARIIFKDFETSNWTWDPVADSYYWHRFYSHQPDLNYDNPRVEKEIKNIIDFWLDMGVDGLRLDAVPYLYETEDTNCENLPETHLFLKRLRAHIDKKYKHRMILAEANQWPEDAAVYFGSGDECHMAFNFPIMPRMFMALQMEDRFPIIDILEPLPNIPDNCQWALFLRNHDELTLEMVTDEERDYMYRVYAQEPQTKINLGIRRRFAPLLRNHRRRMELMNALLFSLPGTPVIYYGDEIGMGDNYYLGDRDGVRTPMQWSPDRNAGFSKANPQRLYLPVIIDPEYHYEVVNIENHEKNPSSYLWWMKRMIGMRKRFKALSRGDIRFLSPENHKIMAFIRQYQGETLLVVMNLSRFSQAVELDLSDYKDYIPVEVFSHNKFPKIRRGSYILTMGPHNFFWFLLESAGDINLIGKDDYTLYLEINKNAKMLLDEETKGIMESNILPKYLKNSRWFGGKGKVIRKITIKEDTALTNHTYPHSSLLMLEVSYNNGPAELYLLPLFSATRGTSSIIEADFPQAVICRIKIGEDEGILYDGSYNYKFHQILIDAIAKRKKLKGREGEYITLPSRGFKEILKEKTLPMHSSILKAEQTNTSIIYENTFILKLYRRLDRGMHPDAEIVKALTEKAQFPHIPPFAGAIEYRSKGPDLIFIGLLQGYVPNAGDAWSFTLDNVIKFLETVLTKRLDIDKFPQMTSIVFEEDDLEQFLFLDEYIDAFFIKMARLLGERTAQMHLALSSIEDDPAFSPEPFSKLYQRSIFQSMRTLLRQVIRLLKENIYRFPAELKKEAVFILASEDTIIKRFEKIFEKKISATKIRIHGDYHLGQILFTGKDFYIIDFEGEPAHALSERRLKRTPLRDIAGMVRSFHYAAYAGLLKNPFDYPKNRGILEPWIKNWYHYISSLFLQSYMNTVRHASFLPRKIEDFNTLFNAFLLEKAVYELGYELNNRPDWVTIPISGIKYILSEENIP